MQLESSTAAAAAASEELARYKLRAHSVLKAKNDELERVQSDLNSRLALTAEYDALKLGLEEQKRSQFSASSPAQTQALKDEIERLQTECRALSDAHKRVESEYTAKITDLNATIKTLQQNHAQALSEAQAAADAQHTALRTELQALRQRSRESTLEREKELALLQHKLKLALSHQPLSAAHELLATMDATAAGTGSAGATASTSGAAASRQTPPHTPRDRSTVPPSPASGDDSASSTQDLKTVALTPQKPGAAAAAPNDGLDGELLHLASIQAQRDAQLNKQQTRIRQLQQLVREQELALAGAREKEQTLGSRVTELERALTRDKELSATGNMEYLKNIIVKYMETGEEVLPCTVPLSCRYERLISLVCVVIVAVPCDCNGAEAVAYRDAANQEETRAERQRIL